MVHYQKSEYPVKIWIAVFKVKVTAEEQLSIYDCLHDIFLTTELFSFFFFFLTNWVWRCIVWSQSVIRRGKKVHCHQGQGHSEGSYDQNMTVSTFFWRAGPFATKCGLMKSYHKLWCLVKNNFKKDSCVQGQGHREISICQWMFVWMRSSGPPNYLSATLVWWCIIMSQSVIWKGCFAVFTVKVTVKVYIIKIWLSAMSSELLILLQQTLVWWHIIVSWLVLWIDCIAVVCWRSGSQQRFKVSLDFYLDHIFSTAELFVTKFGMVMHHHRPERYAKRLVAVLKIKVT